MTACAKNGLRLECVRVSVSCSCFWCVLYLLIGTLPNNVQTALPGYVLFLFTLQQACTHRLRVACCSPSIVYAFLCACAFYYSTFCLLVLSSIMETLARFLFLFVLFITQFWFVFCFCWFSLTYCFFSAYGLLFSVLLFYLPFWYFCFSSLRVIIIHVSFL